MTLRGNRVAAGALVAITLLAWANSFEAGLILDNRTLLLENARVREATTANVAAIVNHTYWWPNEESGLYRPVTTLSYMFNYAILGNKDHPAGYHWFNFLLHALNVLLAFVLARRLTGRDEQSFVIAAVWAVHPVLTESVTNIVGRADLLAALTLLGGLWLYMKSMEASMETAGAKRFLWLAALLALTCVGAFSKESGVVVIGAVALYEWTWFGFRRWRGFLFGCAAMLPGLVGLWWMRSRVLAASAPTLFPFVDNPIVAAGFITGRLTALKVMGKYLWLLVWPAKLSIDYSYAQIPLADGRFTDWLAWITVAAVAVAAILAFRRNKLVFFAAGVAFMTLLPSANLLIPVGTIMAERFLYLPALAFSVCLSLAIYTFARRLGSGPGSRLAARLTVCLVIAALGARTWARNADWKDSYSLWSAAVHASPVSFKAHTGLAQAMIQDHFNIDLVLAENEKSIAIIDALPDRLNTPSVYIRTAAQHLSAGYRFLQPPSTVATSGPGAEHFERARTLLNRTLAILKAQRADREKASSIPGQPGDPKLIGMGPEVDAYGMLSETEQRLGRSTGALRWAREAQAAGPLTPATWGRLHDVLLAAGRRPEARAAIMEGLLLTEAPALLRVLLAEYSDDPAERKCAISFDQLTPSLNTSCPSIRTLACSVSPDAQRIAAGTSDATVQTRVNRELTQTYGCK